jgi:arginyl-tRNA synthetase
MNSLFSIKQHVIKVTEDTFSGSAFLSPDLLQYTPEIKFGNFSLPCFSLSKKLRQSPQEIANTLAKCVLPDDVISAAHALNGYCNFSIRKEVIWPAVLSSLVAEFQKRARKPILLEYSQPNTHKEFHVGHLRNLCIGAALVNIFRFLGYSIIPVSYVNDGGSHVAKCLWAYLKFHHGEEPQQGKGEFLGKLYMEGAKSYEESEEVKKEVSILLQKLEGGDEETILLWEKTREWSLQQFEDVYQELSVDFDHVYYESDLIHSAKGMVSELLRRGIAREDNGAILIDLSPYKLDVFLLQKSDGTSLYATKDLALAKKKAEDYDVEESVIITDNRQSFYFKQLFQTLMLSGFQQKMTHIPYEFVTLPSGTMSSRTGNVVLYKDLMNQAIEKAKMETQRRHSEWSKKKIDSTAHSIAIAALKFGMLKHENNQVITFDLDRTLSFEGDTGPYALYTYARLRSIIRRAEERGLHEESGSKVFQAALLVSEEEERLLSLLIRFTGVAEKAGNFYQPSLIATYLLDVCHAVNEFYHHCPVLAEENEEIMDTRFNLICQITPFIQKLLLLLNIRVIEEM